MKNLLFSASLIECTFAKHLLSHGLNVVIAVVDPPDNDAVLADAIARLAAANPSITFRLLPTPSSPDLGAHPVNLSLDTLRLASPVLREFLRSRPAVDALFLNMSYLPQHAVSVLLPGPLLGYMDACFVSVINSYQYPSR